MTKLSFLSPKTEKRNSAIHGFGLFAVSSIKKGETVAIKGGYIMTRDEWANIQSDIGDAAEIQLSDDLVIAPRHQNEFDGCMMALNHSCDPNVGVDGQITYVTMRDISAGEQLCLDYAMIDDLDGAMDCNCNTPHCRKIVDGKDWQLPDLQRKYKGYFATFITKKIKKLSQTD